MFPHCVHSPFPQCASKSLFIVKLSERWFLVIGHHHQIKVLFFKFYRFMWLFLNTIIYYIVYIGYLGLMTGFFLWHNRRNIDEYKNVKLNKKRNVKCKIPLLWLGVFSCTIGRMKRQSPGNLEHKRRKLLRGRFIFILHLFQLLISYLKMKISKQISKRLQDIRTRWKYIAPCKDLKRF